MKKIIIPIIIVLIIVLAIILIIKFRKGNVIMGSVEEFNFFYTRGYAYNADIRYRFYHDVKDNEYVIVKKPYGKSEEESLKIEVSEEFQKKLVELLNKYKVSSWDGFNESDKDVLDGDSFSLTVIYNLGKVHASGYMSWPKNYSDFKKEIIALFDVYFSE